jgi:hypothetical protein
MTAIGSYLRSHPWQRRLLTGSVALVVGVASALVLYRPIRDRRLIRRLASDDAQRRAQAIREAAALAAARPAFIGRLENALGTDDDRLFEAVVTVLRRLGRFDVPGREGQQIDRIGAIELAALRSPADPEAACESRALIVTQMALGGRDNRYVRRALRGAVADGSANVRSAAAVLAAGLHDAAALRTLAADTEPLVAAGALIDAALGAVPALTEAAHRALGGGADANVIAAGAYALARLRGPQAGEAVGAALRRAKGQTLRARLLHAATLAGGPHARRAVLDALAAGAKDHLPEAMALLAAGKLRIADAAPHVRRVLAATSRRRAGLTARQALAAIDAADRLGLAVRRQVHAFCRDYWQAGLAVLMTRAAEVLGRQARIEQPGDPNAPTPRQCIQTLRRKVLWPLPPRAGPAGPPPRPTPVPSAAAAAALWRLQPSETYWLADPNDEQDADLVAGWDRDPNASAAFVHFAAQRPDPNVGDYLSWTIGRSGLPEAMGLGLSLLPPRAAPVPLRVYDDNARCTGAMLLALAARSPADRRRARRRIKDRLFGGVAGGEPNITVRGSYHCALLVLGRRASAGEVRKLLHVRGFPPRRAVTALCAAADPAGLDWLLTDPDRSLGHLVDLLVRDGLGEVLAAAAPDLPGVDAAADWPTQLWQARICQDYYLIHRGRMEVRLRR